MLNKRLDDAQLSAVFHNTGPALVVAGPGSGKTTVIISRVIYLIQQYHILPENILVLTFTKAAAQSLQERFQTILKQKVCPVNFSTFHSIFYLILRQYGSYKNPQIITTNEKFSLISQLGVSDKSLIGDISYAISYVLNNPQIDLESMILPGIDKQEFIRIYKSYLRQLQMENMLDFDQMAELTYRLIKKQPEILKLLQEKYIYILVDEFQDTNPYQYEFLKLVAGDSQNLFVVGDDDQAIYGFRGSSPTIMEQFQNDFDSMRYYCLFKNYRSAKQIVADANQVISENQLRINKKICAASTALGNVSYFPFETKEMEYQHVVERVNKWISNCPMEEIAIIGRTNRQVEEILQVFHEVGIACQMNSTTKRKRYSKVTEHLIGLIEYILGDMSKARYWRKISSAHLDNAFYWRDKHSKLLMNHLIRNSTFLQFLDGLRNDNTEIKRELDILLMESGRHRTLDDFLNTLKQKVEIQESEGRGVHVLTMHGSKGLEFGCVCLIDINEGIIPGKQCSSIYEVEEERRMLYVGMTRAKKILDVCYLTGTKEHPRLASRFLNPFI